MGVVLHLTVGFVVSELISQKGLNNVTVDTLVQEITPKARSK